MTNRWTIIFLALLFIVTNSCSQNGKQQTSSNDKTVGKQTKNDPIIKQVTQLDEFKQAERQVDSLKKISPIPLDISIDILHESFLNEDVGKNISLVFIKRNSPYDDKILYTIKFDKDKQKIISVDKNTNETELEPEFGDLPLPTDTIPKK